MQMAAALFELSEIENEMFGLLEMNPIDTEQPPKVVTCSENDAKESQESSDPLGGRP